jgi:hypothetical protein
VEVLHILVLVVKHYIIESLLPELVLQVIVVQEMLKVKMEDMFFKVSMMQCLAVVGKKVLRDKVGNNMLP